jgi:hypothetical protein
MPKSPYDQQSLNEKKVDFTKFLNSILLNEELVACNYFEEFISIHDYKGFKEVKKMREKETRPKAINEFYT